jgi:hypothetical protein
MLVKELTSKCLESALEELKREENMTKIQKEMLDPLIHYTYNRIYPYFLITMIIFLLTFILALLIFILLVKNILKSNI